MLYFIITPVALHTQYHDIHGHHGMTKLRTGPTELNHYMPVTIGRVIIISISYNPNFRIDHTVKSLI